MAKLLTVALALIAGAVSSTPQASRIFGGSPASIEDFPSIVQVESLSTGSGIWSQTCGGNILTARHVLSAAHCFHGITCLAPRIRAGTPYRQTGGLVINVDMEFNHPTYGQNDNDGDISVVRLQQYLQFSDVIQQGPIVAQGFYVPAPLQVVIAGWGATQLGGLASEELKHTAVYTVNLELCAERYAALSLPRKVTTNMICAGILDEGGRDACEGDFGGPVYYEEYLIGVMSFGQDCGNGTMPLVATAVSSYTDWIVDNAMY